MTETLIKSTPDPNTVTLVSQFIRDILKIGAALGFATGWATDSVVVMIATLGIEAASIGWGYWEKYRAAQAIHTAAVTSAVQGTPLQPANAPGV